MELGRRALYSAGIGRTGTYIALDNVYSQAIKEGTVNILRTVASIKEQRTDMNQTIDQYVYLYEVVADSLLFGTCFVWPRQFGEIYEYLIDVPHNSRQLRLKTQFDLIMESVRDKRGTKIHIKELNNEYAEVFIQNTQSGISVDERRPKSRYQEYVQAVGALLLQNHQMKDTFIICKSPIEFDLDQFWSLVQEQRIKTIVCLEDRSSLSSKKSFLGLNRTEMRDKYNIFVKEECKLPTYEEKKIAVTLSTGDITISHFQYTNTNSEHVPQGADSMANFVKTILDRQGDLSETEPILVYCNDTVKQCGLMCCLLSEINRIKIDGGHINIVHTVKLMKEREPGIVEDFDQYLYIYDVILAHVRHLFRMSTTTGQP